MSGVPSPISALAFFEALYGEAPQIGQLAIWALPSEETSWIPAGDWAGAVTATSRFVERGENVYFGVALQDLEARLRIGSNGRPCDPTRVRGTNDTALVLPALHAEIDCISPGKPSGVPSLDEALDALRELPLRPSILTFSGWGVHAYWLLREPADLTDAGQREVASRSLVGWQAFIRGRWHEYSWGLDKTSELARVLRVPGTVNLKYEQRRPVRIDLFEPSVRYNLCDFEPYLLVPERKAPIVETWTPLDPIKGEAVAAVEFEVAVRAMRRGDGRHASALNFACQLRDARVPREIASERSAALLRVARSLPGRPIPDDEFQKAVIDAYKATPRTPSERSKEATAKAERDVPNRDRPLLHSLADVLALIRPRDPIPTGLPWLDQNTGGGLAEGESAVIGGAPGALKTTVACQVAANMANRGAAVCFVAWDEGWLRVGRKLGANFGERYAELGGDYPPVTERLRTKLSDRDLMVFLPDPSSGATFEEIAAAFRETVPEGRTLVYIVDLIQTIDVEASADDDAEPTALRKVVDSLLAVTKKQGAVVIALSEVTKAALTLEAIEAGPLAAFAGSRRIASRFDVPVVMAKTGERSVRVYVAKNRLGPTGRFSLELDVERWKLIQIDELEEGAARADAAREQATGDERVVVDILRAAGPLRAMGVEAEARAKGMPRARLRAALERLRTAGVVIEVRGAKAAEKGPAPVLLTLSETSANSRRTSAETSAGVSHLQAATTAAAAPPVRGGGSSSAEVSPPADDSETETLAATG